MSRYRDNETGMWLVVIIGVLIIAMAWVFMASMEAASYNRVTGKNVTTWDAMWIDLRVQSEAR